MLHLQQKAYLAMEEYERQRDSPTGRFAQSNLMSSGDDDDELSILGGKTRLVGKREPMSPILNKSPISRNPVVPLPLPLHAGSHFDPNVWEYLSSFSQMQPDGRQRLQAQPADGSSGNFAEPEPSMSTFVMTAMTPSYQSSVQYAHEDSQMRAASSTQKVQLPQAQCTPGTVSGTSIPQYFPVYDYTMSNSGSQPPATLAGNGNPGQISGSPTMQTVWQDFVHHVAM
jgi:hypothetical protein